MDAAQGQVPPRQVQPRLITSPADFCFIVWLLFWCMVAPALLLTGGAYVVVDQTFYQEPHYSVSIDSVSGLDPVFGGRPALDPEFNLTFRVASHGFWVRECAEPGIRLDVSYRGVSLASGMTTAEKICARPRKAVDQSLVARGAGVVVPGSVLDSLAGDMRNVVLVFEVALRGRGVNATWTCGPSQVGDDYALQRDCAKTSATAGGHA